MTLTLYNKHDEYRWREGYVTEDSPSHDFWRFELRMRQPASLWHVFRALPTGNSLFIRHDDSLYGRAIDLSAMHQFLARSIGKLTPRGGHQQTVELPED